MNDHKPVSIEMRFLQEKQALCSVLNVLVWRGTSDTPARDYLVWCGGPESFKSWVYNYSTPITSTDIRTCPDRIGNLIRIAHPMHY